MELQRYIKLLGKWWWLIVASTVISTGASYYSLSGVPRIFQATTTVVVGQTLQQANPNTQDIAISQQLAQTYREMVSRRPIREAAAEALELSYVPGLENISARLVEGTQLLEISARDTDPERARLLADEIAHQLILQTPNNIEEDQARLDFVRAQLKTLEQNINDTQEELTAEQAKLDTANSARAIAEHQSNIAALQQKLAQYQSTYASYLQAVQGRSNYIAVVEPAVTPSQPISPKVNQTLLLAAAIGLALALGGAILMEYLDDTVKTPEDVAGIGKLSTLGAIARFGGKKPDDRLIPAREPTSTVAEAYRAMRTNLQLSSIDKPLHTLLVTSPGPLEGKSTTVANLGVVMAQAGRSVLLVDADLRRPSLHRIFQVSNRTGLRDLLLQDEPAPDGFIQPTQIENLRLLTSGALPPDPAELLGSEKMRRVVEGLKQTADIVIFDTPPILPVSDALVLATYTDDTMLVVQAGRTRRAAAQKAVGKLHQLGVRVLGVTLNLLPSRASKSYYHYYDAGRKDDEKGFLRRRKKAGQSVKVPPE